MHCRLLPILLIACICAPAKASTLPPLDFHQGQKIIALGVVDGNFDWALTDNLSVGGSLIWMNGHPELTWGLYTFGVGALRSTYRIFGAPGSTSFGLTVSVGQVSGHPLIWNPNPNDEMPRVLSPTRNWFQPALNISVPVGSISFRGTIGPIFGADLPPGIGIWDFWPNFELAYQINSGNELTLGGNSVVGWRFLF